MKNNKGFTLIELIVSISLILLLFTIVVPSSVKLVQNSNKKHCQSIVDELLTAADLYAIEKIRFEDITEAPLDLYYLYEQGYIEKEYDFKNGYTIKEGYVKKNSEKVSATINIKRTTDETDTENKRGYNTYELVIDYKYNYDICK